MSSNGSSGMRSLRSDEAFSPPKVLPREFTLFETEVTQLGVGQAGKVGLLQVELEALNGKTRIKNLFFRVPLQVQKALYLDPALPGMAFLTLLNPTGGILQGDRLRINILAKAWSLVHITTQAATKLYRMEENYAIQTVNIQAEEGTYVEYLPDPVIPFQGSRFYQEVTLQVHEEATLLFWEILLPGRVAMGESFAYELYASKVMAFDQRQRLLLLDTLLLQPRVCPLKKKGILGDQEVVGSFYLLTRRLKARELAGRLHEVFQEEGSLGGTSELPTEAGVVARVLGPDSRSVSRALERAWKAARLALLGAPAPPPRKP